MSDARLSDAVLLRDTSEHDASQSLLAALLDAAAEISTASIEIFVCSLSPMPPFAMFKTADGTSPPSRRDVEAMARSLAGGRNLHVVADAATARLWLRGPADPSPAIAWLTRARAPRRHPLLPAWRAMADGEDLLLGAEETSAHRRLLQATRMRDAPTLRRLAEQFAARPARLWRRDGVGVVRYAPGNQGEQMACSFEAFLLPVPDDAGPPSETRESNR
jgi:hypothetical protein